MFVYKSDQRKDCEALVVRNVSEPIQNLQRYCDQNRPNNVCNLNADYIRSIFITQALANDQFYPVRMEIRYDCSGKFQFF
jgi:hypothetical protein